MQRLDTHNVVKWFLSGATFLGVVGSAGCSLNSLVAAKAKDAPSGPADFETLPGASSAHAAKAGASVNAMGDVNGVEAAPTPSSSGNFQQHTSVAEGADSDVVVDPSGKFIAFASTRHGDHSEIYLQKVGGQSVTQLTSDSAESAFPCFSPDGKKIAFSSTRAGNWDIYVMDVDGRNVVQVTNGQWQDMHASFSPEGDRIVYSSLGRENSWELWTVDLGSNERKMIGYGLFPSWSPEKGKDRIAFQRARLRGSRIYSLWTLDLVDGEACRITEVAASSNAAIVSPTWSPDGKQLAFATLVDPNKGAGIRSRGQTDIWAIDADGGNRRRLTDGTGTNLTPAWAVDNRVYFVSSRGGNEAIWSVKAGAGVSAMASKGESHEVKREAHAENSESHGQQHDAGGHGEKAPKPSHGEHGVADTHEAP